MAISRLAWVVLALVLSGALWTLLGADHLFGDSWLGRVMGSTYGVCLWLGAWLYARYPDRIFSTEWSVAERRGWAGLVFVTLISIAYLRFMLGMAAMDVVPTSIHDIPAGNFVAQLVVLFIAWGIVSSGLRTNEAGAIEVDERDLRLRAAADRVGDWGLTILIAWCAGLLAFQPADRLAWWLMPQIAANVLIGILIAKTLAEHVYLVGRYAWDRR